MPLSLVLCRCSCEEAAGPVVTAGDEVLVSKAQHVLAAEKAGNNRERGTGQVGAVRVADLKRPGDGRGCPVLRVPQCRPFNPG